MIHSKFAIVAIMILVFLTNHKSSEAQDIHFSQFYNAPFNLNPALVGQFDGAYRFVANQRTQWRSVTIPYSTFGLSADAHQLVLPDGVLNPKDGKKLETDWNLGLSFFKDKAGDSQLTTNSIQLVLGKEFGMSNGGFISAAMMVGYTAMKIDYSALNYDNQWNGFNYDPNINSNENYARSQRSYLNMNLGTTYIKRFSKKENLTLGISLFNITNPKQSFFDDGYVKLDPRINFHVQYLFAIKEEWLAEPMLLWATQGPYKELNFGGRAHYMIMENKWLQQSIYFGAMGRARDAGYLIAGLRYNDWDVGISYDINTSNLKPASSGKGGFEFSAIYILPKAPKAFPAKYCKDWM